LVFVETKGVDPKRGERVLRAQPQSRGHAAPTLKYDTTDTWVELSTVPNGASSILVSNAGTEAIAVAVLGPSDTDLDKYHVVLPGQYRMVLVTRYDKVWAKTA